MRVCDQKKLLSLILVLGISTASFGRPICLNLRYGILNHMMKLKRNETLIVDMLNIMKMRENLYLKMKISLVVI